jgi:RimJ/RimL family protein N-acetyltransferase
MRRRVRHHQSEDSTHHGSTRFYGYDPEKSEIEIGWTFLARKYWGGRYNTEMKRLLLNHAFKFVESVVFFVGEENIRSQKAMERVGAIKVGTVTRTYGNRPPTPNVKYVISKGASPAQPRAWPLTF